MRLVISNLHVCLQRLYTILLLFEMLCLLSQLVCLFAMSEGRLSLRREVVGGQEIRIALDDSIEIIEGFLPLAQLQLHHAALVVEFDLVWREVDGLCKVL